MAHFDKAPVPRVYRYSHLEKNTVCRNAADRADTYITPWNQEAAEALATSFYHDSVVHGKRRVEHDAYDCQRLFRFLFGNIGYVQDNLACAVFEIDSRQESKIAHFARKRADTIRHEPVAQLVAALRRQFSSAWNKLRVAQHIK